VHEHDDHVHRRIAAALCQRLLQPHRLQVGLAAPVVGDQRVVLRVCLQAAGVEAGIGRRPVGNLGAGGGGLRRRVRGVYHVVGSAVLVDDVVGVKRDELHGADLEGVEVPAQPDTTGLLTGLTLGTTLENVARAALESTAFQINDLLIAIRGIAGDVGVLSVDGGAAANSSLMQLQADLSGRSVRRPKATDLSALGAAQLAGLAVGLWSLDDLDALPRLRDEFTPATSAHWRDAELALWRTAIRRTRYHPERENPKEEP
jgi:hypothetical protein